MSKIIIVGDLFPVPSNFDLFSKGDIQTLFEQKICNLFASADYRICNLEGALSDNNDFCEKTGPVVKAPTNTVRAIKNVGINCCTLANNHITDAGHQGIIDTMLTLDKVHIAHIGAGVNKDNIRHYHFFEVNGKKFLLYNVAETMYNEPTAHKGGAYLYDEYLVCKELEELKSKCDYLIVIYHGGAEKFRYPSPQTRKRFHRMVDSGANMILSQHTHCVGCEEYYKDAYLLYGQGNFLFRSFNNEFTDTGLIIELVLEDGKATIKKHLVNAVGDTVRYDERQDFSEFNERSIEMKNEDLVLDKFKEYCLKEVPIYISAYKGKSHNLFLKVFNILFPHKMKEARINNYSKHQLLFTLHSLRSEQNREVAIEGIKQLMKTRNYK